jgi:hypothetical protein
MKTLLLVPLFLIGCSQPTKFTGSARVPHGRAGCNHRCKDYGMVLVGIVTMGDSYTDGCICGVPTAPGVAAAAMAAGPAVAGVIIQQRRAEAQAGQQQQPRATTR